MRLWNMDEVPVWLNMPYKYTADRRGMKVVCVRCCSRNGRSTGREPQGDLSTGAAGVAVGCVPV